MVRISSRVGALICLLVLLQECGPAHFATLSKARKSVKQNAHDKHPVKNLKAAENALEVSSKRSIATLLKFGSKLFKGIEVAGEVLNYATTAASVLQQVFDAISQCCIDTKACEYRDEFLKLQAEVKEQSVVADDLELEIENQEEYINSSISKYEEIILNLNRIGDSQLRYLNSLSPEMGVALNNASHQAEKYIAELNEKGKEAEYLTVSRFYRTAIENTVAIGTPLLGLLVPAGEAIFKHAKNKVTASKVNKLERKGAIRLKNPPSGSANSGSVKASRNLGTTQSMEVSVTKAKQSRSTKAITVVKKIAKVFVAGFNLASAAFNIYGLIQQAQVCQDKEREAKQARDQMLETKQTFIYGMGNLTESKEEIRMAFKYLRGNMTDEPFTDNVVAIREMVENVTQIADSDDLDQVAGDLTYFQTAIADETLSGEATYDLMQNKLLLPLTRVPFSVQCYTDKNAKMQDVFGDCKHGQASFDSIYADSFASSDSNCDAQIGPYINKDTVEQMLEEVAKTQNFDKDCLKNNKALIENCCRMKLDGYEAPKIAEDNNVSQDVVEEILEDCSDTVEVTPAMKAKICDPAVLALPASTVALIYSIDESVVVEVRNTCNE